MRPTANALTAHTWYNAPARVTPSAGMKTAFDFEVRLIACTHCGAPLAVGTARGQLECGYCGRATVPQAPSRHVTRSPTIPEAERLQRLREQDRRGDVSASHPLLLGPDVLPWKVSEALAEWSRARTQTLAGQAGAEWRLHQLSLALAHHFGDEGDTLRERSLLEGALEASRERWHRQSLIGALTRSASRAGDVAAAAAWLNLCDPTPDNLVMDTDYRFARATLATARGSSKDVLAVLGADALSIPLHDRWEGACVALRAHGLESRGATVDAIAALDTYLRAASPFQAYWLRRFVERHAHWGLCAASAPAAERQRRLRGGELSAGAAGTPMFAFVAAVGAVVVGAAVAVPLMLFVGPGPAHIAAGICGLLATIFSTLFFYERAKANAARRIRHDGVVAPARVMHARSTGQWTMGVPELLYRAMVLPPSGAPFLAHAMLHADDALQRRLAPGALVIVNYDPQRRGHAQFEIEP